MKHLLWLLALIVSLSTFSQTIPPRTQLQPINAKGYEWLTGSFKRGIYINCDTLPNADTGTMVYKNGMVWIKGVSSWGALVKASQLSDSTFQVGFDTVTIRGTGGGGATDTISISNDSLYTNSNVLKKAIPFQSFRNRKVAIQVDTIFATSTSFGVSYGLTNVNQGNFEILADRLKMALLNHAMGGLDIEAACVEVSANIRPGVNKYMQVSAVGYNLLRYAGNNDSAYKQLQDGIRSIIATNIIDTIFYGDNARITQHGTWGTSTYASYGGKSGAFGGNGLYSNSNNDSLKIQITGDAIVVGYINQVASGGESGTFNIYVDNVLRKTVNAKNACGISDGTYSNLTTPGAVLLDGLGAGIHTVRIVNTQAKYLYFDYIATTKATNECAPIIISLIPKMTAAGYSVSPANASDAIFNNGDSVIMAAVNEFSNYPVTVSYPNDYFNPVTQTQGDNVHPTEAGQAAIAYANSIQIFTAEKVPAGGISQWSNTSGGIYFPSGNVGIGSTATSPATALQIKSSAPAFRMDDANGDNAAFYGNFTNFAQLAINRNPSTGVFTNTGKATAQISLKSDAGEGSIFFYTTNTNNTSPTQRAILDGLGNFGFGSVVSPTARLHLPGVTTSAGTAPIKLESGSLMTTPEAGALEFASSHLWFTIGSTRYIIDQQDAPNFFNTDLRQTANRSHSAGNFTLLYDSIKTLNLSGRGLNYQGKKRFCNLYMDATNSEDLNDFMFLRHLWRKAADDGDSARQALVFNGNTGLRLESSNDIFAKSSKLILQYSVATLFGGDYLQIMGIPAAANDSIFSVGSYDAATKTNVVNKIATTSSSLPHTLDKKLTSTDNSGTTETDLYSYTVPANKLLNNGNSLTFNISGTFNDATSTADIQFYFAGTSFANTGALTISVTSGWSASGYVQRLTPTTALATVTVITPGATLTSFVTYLDLTGLDFTTTNIFKVTGQAGGAGGGTGDITLKPSAILFWP